MTAELRWHQATLRLCVFSLLLPLGACGLFSEKESGEALERDGAPEGKFDVSGLPDAVPMAEPKSRYGNPKSYEVMGQRYYVMDSADDYEERGIASWYGTKFHGRRTSSGDTYDMYAMTAAHKTLPLPTYVEVTHLGNGRNVIVKVNDRGPFHHRRIIDLSYAAAIKLGVDKTGTADVLVRALDPGKSRRPPQSKAAESVPVGEASAQESAPQTEERFKDDDVRYAPVTVKDISAAASGSVDSGASVGRPQPAWSERSNSEQSLYVQIGAFGARDRAEGLLGRLRTAGMKALISPMQRAGQTLHRVLIGPLTDMKAASAVIKRLPEWSVGNYQIIKQ
ncbi:MAG: septal ring lytic transglycosylase RlpA family protein [Candidatus Eutrophobiaceae bacterium]